VQDDRVTALRNFIALVAVNNTPVFALAGRTHAASSWPCDLLLVSLDALFSCLFFRWILQRVIYPDHRQNKLKYIYINYLMPKCHPCFLTFIAEINPFLNF